jgi:hypothetical protein
MIKKTLAASDGLVLEDDIPGKYPKSLTPVYNGNVVSLYNLKYRHGVNNWCLIYDVRDINDKEGRLFSVRRVSRLGAA